MWCRGTITELIPIESENIRKLCSPTKFSVYEVALIQIFMVDFGNSEVLIVAGYDTISYYMFLACRSGVWDTRKWG